MRPRVRCSSSCRLSASRQRQQHGCCRPSNTNRAALPAPAGRLGPSVHCAVVSQQMPSARAHPLQMSMVPSSPSAMGISVTSGSTGIDFGTRTCNKTMFSTEHEPHECTPDMVAHQTQPTQIAA